MKSRRTYQDQFKQGHYAELAQLAKGQVEKYKVEAEVIASLALIGEVERAEAFFEIWFSTKAKRIRRHLAQQEPLARFFMAVSYMSRAQYKQASRLFFLNALRRYDSPYSRFYALQSVAFFRFSTGRLHQAYRWAEQARKVANQEDYSFELLLAEDLLGHAQANLGQLRIAKKTFKSARTRAELIRNRNLTETILMSSLIFSCWANPSPRQNVQKLTKALKDFFPNNAYSRGEIGLELANQFILMGRCSEARKILDEANDTIYAGQERVQIALLNLRYAHIYYLQGKSEESLSLIRAAELSVDPQFHISMREKLRGLKARILKERLPSMKPFGQATSNSNLKSSEDFIHRRILSRDKQSDAACSEFEEGQDPVGDLIDRASRKDYSVVDQLIENQLLLPLHLIYDLRHGSRTLIFDRLPKGVIILNSGDVSVIQKLFSGKLRSVVSVLAAGWVSKERLLEEVWGYQYDPERHDHLIYVTIAKVRRALGEAASWLENSELGYRLHPDIQVVGNTPQAKLALGEGVRAAGRAIAIGRTDVDSDAAKIEFDNQRLVQSNSGLNWRQMRLLNWIRESAIETGVNVEKVQDLFAISRATATRDLSDLVKGKLLMVSGRARATRYHLLR